MSSVEENSYLVHGRSTLYMQTSQLGLLMYPLCKNPWIAMKLIYATPSVPYTIIYYMYSIRNMLYETLEGWQK